MKKLIALVLALAMVATLGLAFAQTESVGGGTAKITVGNASKGETYTLVKIFDVKRSAEEGESIAYEGDIPTDLAGIFTKNATTGEITAVASAIDTTTGELTADAAKTIKTWAEKQTPVKDAVSDGSLLEFTNLPFGYYVVLTTQGAGAVSVTSTNPNATIKDKNTTTPDLEYKKVNGQDDYNAKIGETVTYTVGFKTANFNGTKRIIEYTIHDTLPAFLGNVTVTDITVGGTSIEAIQFNADKQIVIPWADNKGSASEPVWESKYANGAEVVITYTAKILDGAQVAGNGNTNEVDLSWKDDEGNPYEDEDHEDATVTTYGLALKKVSDEGTVLEGAVFQFPFYVKKTVASDGAYIYAFDTLPATFEEGDSADNYTNTITTPESGEITVKGLKAGDKVTVTETQAPSGFNKLAAPVEITPEVLTTTTTHKEWKIKDGQVVEDSVTEATTVVYNNDNLAVTPVVVINNKGTELPSTGGIGTTIFYILGGLLVIGAAVILVARRKAQD